ncbi:hypothetical protein ES703_46803 [subsurface metagenome]
MKALRKLSQNEINTLQKNGCTAENWEFIQVAPGFDAGRVTFTKFYGKITIGSNSGSVNIDGLKQRCGIYRAAIASSQIGNNVFISNIGSSIQNYVIDDNVIIEDVTILITEKGTQFGDGVQLNVLNETAGRNLTLFKDLNAQIAYLQAMYKHDQAFQEKLDRLIKNYIDQQRSDKGRIGRDARIRSCGTIKSVSVGPSATLHGALELHNGTILSCPEHPTVIGAGVIIRDFIISEGAVVEGNATLEYVFVGQGCQIRKQLSAEHSIFFANSEGFHSEVCSVFAGPYSVTHHKSTLLIACMISFFNGGSGTNQSNHMYKLGPVHQGIMERGCKTGSFASLMLESHIPAFSVIIGKHMSNINIPEFPFSYLLEENGKSILMPGFNLFSIGTVRDDKKWPVRDRRKAPQKRDSIIFDVFSPYTIEKMRRGRAILQELYEKTPRGEDRVYYGGIQIRRLLLKKGVRYYTLSIDRYLIGRIMTAIEKIINSAKSWADVARQFQTNNQIANPEKWVDIGGLLALSEKIDSIMQDVVNVRISTIAELIVSLNKVYAAYRDDEWAYVCFAAEQEYGLSPERISFKNIIGLVKKWENAATSLNSLILENTKSEFSNNSMIGYGLGLDDESKLKDFTATRGTFDTHPVIEKLSQEKEQIKLRAEKFEKLFERFS